MPDSLLYAGTKLDQYLDKTLYVRIIVRSTFITL